LIKKTDATVAGDKRGTWMRQMVRRIGRIGEKCDYLGQIYKHSNKVIHNWGKDDYSRYELKLNIYRSMTKMELGNYRFASIDKLCYSEVVLDKAP
jgi:hypothetical protein